MDFSVNSGYGKLIDSSLTTFNGFPTIDYRGFNSEGQLYEVGRDILKDGDLRSGSGGEAADVLAEGYATLLGGLLGLHLRPGDRS